MPLFEVIVTETRSFYVDAPGFGEAQSYADNCWHEYDCDDLVVEIWATVKPYNNSTVAVVTDPTQLPEYLTGSEWIEQNG
jgi:hypothetical protein